MLNGVSRAERTPFYRLSGDGVEGDVPTGLEGNGVAVLPGDVDSDEE